MAKRFHGEHILFTGGGTLGPVTPLLAVLEEWRRQSPHVKASWIGTPRGPEKALLMGEDISFYTLSAPKLSRHRWWFWPLIFPHLLYSFIRALLLLRRIKPDIVFTVGGYVSVPAVLAAWLTRVPVWVHQLDALPGLANRLMAPFARRVSVTWGVSAKAFSGKKTRVVNGLVRGRILRGDKAQFIAGYGLNPEKRTVFVIGGGTGAKELNEAMLVIAPALSKHANIIHLTGKGKMPKDVVETEGVYIVREFFTREMADAYAAADAVVARAGMGTILELAALAMPSVLVPIAGSHQEANARVLEERDAAVVLHDMTPQILQQSIEKVLFSEGQRRLLSKQVADTVPTDGARAIVAEARDIVRGG